MKQRLLLLTAVALAVLAASAASAPLAGATPPQPVTITIDETFHAPPEVPAVTGSISASGGVFGELTMASLASVAFRPVGFSFTSPDHIFVYTATDLYTVEDGSFSVTFEASCKLLAFDPETGAVELACAGNWQVNGGTERYTRLKGTGTFTERQDLDGTLAGTGTITLTGTMHTD